MQQLNCCSAHPRIQDLCILKLLAYLIKLAGGGKKSFFTGFNYILLFSSFCAEIITLTGYSRTAELPL